MESSDDAKRQSASRNPRCRIRGERRAGPGLQDFSVGRSVSGPSYHLTVVFDDATGLPIGGRVELHDVEIGKVSR